MSRYRIRYDDTDEDFFVDAASSTEAIASLARPTRNPIAITDIILLATWRSGIAEKPHDMPLRARISGMAAPECGS